VTANEVAAIALGAVLAFWMLGAYNRLVRLRQAVATAFAELDTNLQQRHGLLGELVEAVAPEFGDAPEAVAAVEAARRQARVAADHAAQRPAHAGRLASLALAEQVLRTALTRLVTLIKAGQALHGDLRVRAAVNSLSTAQHRVSATRQSFNKAALDYNRGVQQFPTRLIAGLLGFQVAGKL
jgi:LemA protein